MWRSHYTRRWAVGSMAGIAASIVFATFAPTSAQNGWSFVDSANSPVRYAMAAFVPQIPCAALQTLSSGVAKTMSAHMVQSSSSGPEHCRVSGIIAPEIRFEVNLPSMWSGRFYMYGNAVFAGETPDSGSRGRFRAAALRHRFATASTNTGHDADLEPLATFAGNVDKRVDYAFRAVHLTTVEAKRIIATYYGRSPAYSYWDGCSTGGRQGLISAQRFPADFDGILAGAPVINFVDTLIAFLWNASALSNSPIPLPTMKLVSDAVYAKCDARDGLTDGLIDDPRKCDFNPASDVAQCVAGENSVTCLTPAQSGALSKIYGGMISNGKQVHLGFSVGAEMVDTSLQGTGPMESGWDGWLLVPPGQHSRQYIIGESFVRYFGSPTVDPKYDARNFDFDKDMAKFDDARHLLDANNPDLREFNSRGGKIIMYIGWGDMALPPLMGVDYFERALATNGPDTTDFFRLFMIPGMFHCGGGVGTDRFDAMTPLINWVERGIAPAAIPAAKVHSNRIVRTRPLCPYPQVALYSGTGSIEDAGNFTCRPSR